jgi:hypothetical protein
MPLSSPQNGLHTPTNAPTGMQFGGIQWTEWTQNWTEPRQSPVHRNIVMLLDSDVLVKSVERMDVRVFSTASTFGIVSYSP